MAGRKEQDYANLSYKWGKEIVFEEHLHYWRSCLN